MPTFPNRFFKVAYEHSKAKRLVPEEEDILRQTDEALALGQITNEEAIDRVRDLGNPNKRFRFSDETYYHGTPHGFEGDLKSYNPVYMSADPATASSYAQRGHDHITLAKTDPEIGEYPAGAQVRPLVTREGKYATEEDAWKVIEPLGADPKEASLFEYLDPEIHQDAPEFIEALQAEGFIGADLQDFDLHFNEAESRMVFNPRDVKGKFAGFQEGGQMGKATPGAMATALAGGAVAAGTMTGLSDKSRQIDARIKEKERLAEQRAASRRELLMGDTIEGPKHPRMLAGLDAVKEHVPLGEHLPFMDLLTKTAWGDPIEDEDLGWAGLEALDFLPMTGPPGAMKAARKATRAK